MSRTIRQHVLRRKHYGLCLMLPLVAAGLALGIAQEDAPSRLYEVLGWIALAGAITGFVAFHYAGRCPRCTGNLGGHTHYWRLRGWPGLAPAKFCPFCGVSLDAPCQASEGEPR
jgi:hypothetical protein